MLDAYLAAHPSACDVPIAVEPISISPSDSQSINAAAAFQPSSNPFTSALLSGDYSFPAKSSEPSQFAASPTRTPALPAASTSPESLNSLNQYGSASVWLSSSTDSILQQLKALNLEDELHDLVAEVRRCSEFTVQLISNQSFCSLFMFSFPLLKRHWNI
jgi:hypothetical protein